MPRQAAAVCQHGRVDTSPSASNQWRWQAHPPFGAPGAPPSPEEASLERRRTAEREHFRLRSEPSPAYGRTPQWGLPRPGAALEAGGTRSAASANTAHGDGLGEHLGALGAVSRWLLIAGSAAAFLGFVRYAILVVFRGDSVQWWVEATSAWAVRLGFIVVFAIALATLVAGVRTVLALRGYAYRKAAPDPRGVADGAADPRGRWRIVLSAVIPGVNLFYLPVLLLEVAPVFRRADPRAHRRLWGAWWALLANQAIGVVYWSQLLRPGTQAEANALFLAAVLSASAAVFAALLGRALEAAHGAAPVRRLIFAG